MDNNNKINTPLYPIYLNLKNKDCLVVGGGKVAYRKVLSLLECGALVSVVSIKAIKPIEELAKEDKINLVLRPFKDIDVLSRFLVYSATEDKSLNTHIARLCRESNILLNAVDDPPNCDFYVPAIYRDKSIGVAVTTRGSSPVLAGILRDKISKIIPPSIGSLSDILLEYRSLISNSRLSYNEKRELYKSLLTDEFLKGIEFANDEEIREQVKKCIYSWLD